MVKCYQKGYPRPQFVRKNWRDLNGEWDFAFDDTNTGEAKGWQKGIAAGIKILVPFTYETKMSGIGDETPHNAVWYQKDFLFSKEALGERRLLLHLEGCDYRTKVWLNGVFLGMHQGGYARFSFDATEALCEGGNRLTIKAEDFLDAAQPRGKQRWMDYSFGSKYVQTTGIWKSVWMEEVPACRIERLKITPDVAAQSVLLEMDICTQGESGLCVEAAISYGERMIGQATLPVLQKKLRITMHLYHPQVHETGVLLWSPEHPFLYDLSLHLRSGNGIVDEVGSYFGLRQISIDGCNILLNGARLYQRLLLDQGYWKDSHLTPPNEEALIEDIDKTQALGYNGVRKHQKIEDERFLYWCDVKGLLVWCEMPATYRFHDDAAQALAAQWMEILQQNYNHPSVITWTLFNEAWGISQVQTDCAQRHFTEAMYHLTKSFDPFRPVIANDGREHTVTDVLSLHDYEQDEAVLAARYRKYWEEVLSSKLYHDGVKGAFAPGYVYHGQPVLISEYGGIALESGKRDGGTATKQRMGGVFRSAGPPDYGAEKASLCMRILLYAA